jgi:hypothetical protein
MSNKSIMRVIPALFALLPFLPMSACMSVWTTSAVSTCGGEFTDQKAELYPSDNLGVGQEAYFYLSYGVPREIEGGYIITSYSVDGVPIPESRSSLCEAVARDEISDGESNVSSWWTDTSYENPIRDGVPCPITVGQHSSNTTFTVPNIDGAIKSKIGWFTDGGILLLCIKMFVNFVPAQDPARRGPVE